MKTDKNTTGLNESQQFLLKNGFHDLVIKTNREDGDDIKYVYVSDVLELWNTRHEPTLKSSEGLVKHLSYHKNWHPLAGEVEAIIDGCEYRGQDSKYCSAKIVDHIISHISTITPTPQPVEREWVSVDDRLPNQGVQVLVYPPDYGDDKLANENIGYLSRHGTFEYSDNYTIFNLRNVTHWMQLPQPPKGAQ